MNHFFESSFYFLYRYFVAPVGVMLTFTILFIFNRKVRGGLKLRRSSQRTLNAFLAKKLGQPILIHASSGEFEYAKAVIRELKKQSPETPVVVTYFSPSYAAAISRDPNVDLSLPLPLDLPGPTKSFLAKLQPKCILIARTDLWPEFLRTAFELKIPTLLFACTLNNKSSIVLKSFYRWLFAKLTTIHLVSKIDQKMAQSTLTPAANFVTGDTRYDQVTYRLENANINITKRLAALKRPTLVAGSTWPQDEAVLLPAIKEFIQNKKMTLVIAPHEVSSRHINNLFFKFKEFNLKAITYSHLGDSFITAPTADHLGDVDVLIVDQIGVLAEVYLAGDAAFVGGSFKKKVHSVMEPLAAGLPAFVGPFHTNNREAIEFQSVYLANHLPAVQSANTADELKNKIATWLQQTDSFAENRKLIKQEVEKRQGASQHVIDWVKSLEKNRSEK